jgi:hypothetical protein
LQVVHIVLACLLYRVVARVKVIYAEFAASVQCVGVCKLLVDLVHIEWQVKTVVLGDTPDALLSKSVYRLENDRLLLLQF